MTAIKDLFGTREDIKAITISNSQDVGNKVESSDYLKVKLLEKERVVPHVDFSDPKNFCFYGNAEQYYEDSVSYIQNSYPYDGSLREKLLWQLSGSYLDLWLFENKYPRTNGYAVFGNGNYGTIVSSSNGYGLFSTTNYIFFKGGPHTASGGMIGQTLHNTFDYSNKYDATNRRENNLEIDGTQGITLEFFIKHGGYTSGSESQRQVIFDVWNSASHGANSYGRFRVEIRPDLPNHQHFHIELASGSNGIQFQIPTFSMPGDDNITGSNWNHHALVFYNSGSTITAEHYTNGFPHGTITTGSTTIGLITGSMIGTVGALVTTVSSSASGIEAGLGWGKLSGSLDELRFWKVRRTAEQIGKYWFSQVGGGTNSDEANTDLGLYYKFNEGIIGSSSLDNTVLDYSGRISNGNWIGYVSGNRATGSAIVEGGYARSEFQDPILYSEHSRLANLKVELQESGSAHDVENNASIYSSIPSWITEADEEKQKRTLRKLTQTLSSYLDTLHLQIQEVPRLKYAEYVSTGSYKPYPFINRFLETAGMVSPDVFEGATELETYASRDDFQVFQEKFEDVRNKIYQNIYNNLTYIFKTKGTEKSFRNVIRCFGIGDELVKINLYGDNVVHKIENSYKSISVRKKFVNFNDTARFDGVVFQQTASGDLNTRTFVSSSLNAVYQPNTYEAEFIFPKKFEKESELYFPTTFLTCSLFGAHTAISTAPTDFTWGFDDRSNFQIYAVRTEQESKDVYFILTGGAGYCLPALTSSVFKDVYDGQKWNIFVRIKPTNVLGNSITGSNGSQYQVEFGGYNKVLDITQNSFITSGTISNASGVLFATGSKRFYVGAHKTNFTGSTIYQTDAKVGGLRVWFDYLTNDVLEAHARDTSNFGALYPGRNLNINILSSSLGLNTVYVPTIETLALNWTFDNITGSDTSGRFDVIDLSSGSLGDTTKYLWIGPLTKYQHPGQGYSFGANDSGSVNYEYVYSSRQLVPETLNSNDLVEIRQTDDLEFTRDTRPIKYYFAIENSMYSIVSDEMLKMFATIKDFNNLIGQPVNRYRQNYKDLEKLRTLYFDKVNNTPDFEKYIEYFKWIDGSISKVLQQLIPASAEFSPDLRNVIESHILERNKYWNKYPTLEFKRTEPNVGIKGINELLYSWESGSAPATGLQSDHGYWWKNRAERQGTIGSGDSTVDANRTAYLSASLSTLNRSFTTPIKASLNIQQTGSGQLNVVSTQNIKHTGAISHSNDDSYAVNPVENFTPLGGAYQPLGNYANDYEVVQTTGRYVNHRDFTRAAGADRPLTHSNVITGVVDFTLPDYSDSKNKFIFVNRFSAPGGPEVMSRGSLDIIGEEYSSYNDLNVRNLVVRSALNTFYKIHSAKFGTSSADSTIPNYHKVNRNTGYSLQEISGIVYSKESYDNANVIHQIPRKDTQYAWISASARRDIQQPFGFENSFYIPTGSSGSVSSSLVQFISASEQYPGLDFVGLNTVITESVLIDQNLIDTGNTRSDLNSILLHRNGPYQYPMWKQTRASDNPVSRRQIKQNIISLIDEPKDRIMVNNDGEQIVYRDRRADTFTNYSESVVYSGNKPATFSFMTEDSDEPVELNYSYHNNTQMFGNQEINNKLGATVCQQPVYEQLKNLYTNSPLSPEDNPIKGFVKFSFGSTVFPKKSNIGLSKIRNRLLFVDNAPTENITASFVAGAENGVWDGYAIGDYSVVGIDRGPLDRRTFWFTSSAKRIRHEALRGVGYGTLYKTTIINSQGHRSGFANSIWPMGCELSSSNPKFSTTAPQTVNMSYLNNDNGELNPDYLFESGNFGLTQIGAMMIPPSSSTPTFQWISKPTASALYYHTDFLQIARYTLVTYGNEFGSKWRVNFFAGKAPAYDSYEEFANDIKPINKDMSILPEFIISKHIPYYVDTANGNFRSTNNKFLTLEGGLVSQSATHPTSAFYDTTFFKDYAHSDVVKDYEKLEQDHKDVGQVDKIILSCKGIKKLLPYNGFYPILRTTQLAALLSQSVAPYIGGIGWETGSPSAEFAAPSTDLDSKCQYSGAVVTQALIQPFYAPGIMYNTVKSGIAVDWPAITGTAGIIDEGDGGGAGNFIRTISSSVSYRFPFESILDLKNGGGFGGIPISSSDGTKKTLLMCNPITNNMRFPYFDWRGEKSPLYEMAAHNFFAESINFFLKDNSLKAFVSKPEKEILGKFVNGKSYYMDVVLYKTNDFSMFEGHFNGVGTPYTVTTGIRSFNGKYFGPSWKTGTPGLGGNSTLIEQYADPHQAPNTPPYFYGKAIARIRYTADGTETSNGSLAKIIAEAKSLTSYDNPELFQKILKFPGNNAPPRTLEYERPSWTEKMNVSASVNMFQIVKGKNVEYDNTSLAFKPAKVADESTTAFDKWVIQTKFECPVLNFRNQTEESFIFNTDDGGGNPVETIGYFAKGMWSGYGELPNGKSGIFIAIEESFPNATPAEKETNGSLIDIMGFNTEPQRVGEIAETKEISEAIVAIPFVDQPITNPELANTTNVMGRNFFKLSRKMYEFQKNKKLLNKPAIEPGEDFGDITVNETSISQLSEKMAKYVLPPEMNFDLYNDIDPFVMYIFEFNHILDKQDLADIWQGVLPKIGTRAEKDEINIEHDMKPWELFENKKLPPNVRWMVFKVKKKAKVNYFEFTADQRDDARFQFDFKTGTKRPDYSYNWPYDFCSLVEYGKLEVEFEIKPKEFKPVPASAIKTNKGGA